MRTRKIKLVRQSDKYGCGPASIAMILGKDYDDVVKDFENDFEASGVYFESIYSYLGDHGYSVILKQPLCWDKKDFARKEMLTPFAPVHLVSVQPSFDSENNHCVVMDADGTLFCPGGFTDEQIRGAYNVVAVAGLFN